MMFTKKLYKTFNALPLLFILSISIYSVILFVLISGVKNVSRQDNDIDQIEESFSTLRDSLEPNSQIAIFTNLRTADVSRLYFQTQFVFVPVLLSLDSLTSDTVIVVENDVSKIVADDLRQIWPTVRINNMDMKLCVRENQAK